MCKQFSPSELKISRPGSADSSLHWREYPSSIASMPLYAIISDKNYLLCGGSAEIAIFFAANDKFDALTASIAAMGALSITFSEWVRIYKICSELKREIEELPLPEPLKTRYLTIIKQASGWNEALLAHISAKNPPWHTLQLIYLLTDTQKDYLADFVQKENPTAQSFKLFVEKLRDFAPEINSNIYDKAEFMRLSDRRTAPHQELDCLLTGLRLAQNPDNYESGALNWAFPTRSINEFREILKELKNKEELVEHFYKLLGGKGK